MYRRRRDPISRHFATWGDLLQGTDSLQIVVIGRGLTNLYAIAFVTKPIDWHPFSVRDEPAQNHDMLRIVPD